MSERCAICEGIDQPGLVHNPQAPYCSGSPPEPTDALVERVLERLTQGAHKGGHHPRCATGHDNGCDCYARASAPARAALAALAKLSPRK